MKAVHWGADGNPLNVVPGEVSLLLAEDGKTLGYGYGDGWSMIFNHPNGPVTVEIGQWVVRYDDGRIEVTNEEPANTEIFDAAAALAAKGVCSNGSEVAVDWQEGLVLHEGDSDWHPWDARIYGEREARAPDTAG